MHFDTTRKNRQASKILVTILVLGMFSCVPPEAKSDAENKNTAAKTTPRKTADPIVDKEIMSDLEAIVANCKVDVSGNTVTDCKSDETDILIDKFMQKKKDQIAALDTFVVALNSDNENLSVVASSILYSAFQSFGKLAKGAVSPDVAYHLIEAVGKAPTYRAAQSVRAAVHAAMLAGVGEALYEMLDSHSYPALPGLAYPYVMQYGRMDSFPKIQALAASKDAGLAAAAFAAPLYMYEATAAEKQTVCPWGKGSLPDARPEVYRSAGRLMLWCEGSYIDALQDEGDKRLAANQFTREDSMLYRDICFSPIKGMIPEPGKVKQCQRNQVYLEKAVNNAKLDSLSRGLALFAIYYQRRNAESMKIMQNYKNHADPNIKKYATEAIESLVKSYHIPE